MTVLISAEQFADLLGISVASARQRLYRAGLREQRGYDPDEVISQFRISARKVNELLDNSQGQLSPDELPRLRR